MILVNLIGLRTKDCSTCELPKNLEDFPPDNRRSDGRGSKCRPCAKAVSNIYYSKYPALEAKRRQLGAASGKRWYEKNRTRLLGQQKWSSIKRKYGIDRDQYLVLLDAQGGRCAICRSDHPGRNDLHFAIDHDHVTKKVRGLLCQRCNCAIGFFRDRTDFMRRAIDYVEANQ